MDDQIKDLILTSQFSTKEDLKLSIKTNSNNERITDLFAGNAKPLVKKYDFIKGFEGGYLKFDSIEKNKVSNSNLKILGGIMGEDVLDVIGVQNVATLPSLDEARAKIIGILRSPAQKMASILLAPASKIAILALEKSKK